MKTKTSYFTTDSKTQIHYAEQGEGNTTLLFLHGWGINSRYWDSQLEYFSKNYRVIAMDLPGFGKSKSDRTEWTIQNYGNDVINVIEKLDLKNVILIGHSMSGDIIIEAAIKNHKSIAGIIGIDNFKMIGIEFTKEQMNEMTGMFNAMVNDYRNSVPAFIGRLFHPSTGKDVRARVTDDIVNSDVQISIASISGMFEYSKIEVENLSKLTYKLFLVNSDFGPTNTAGLDKYCGKSFEVDYIHDTGHYPMIEKPEEFNKILAQTINKIY
jgi:pimeloyl-ACP methyl ester carboxylesterase